MSDHLQARLRTIGLCAGLAVLTLLLTQFAFPGSVGSDGRGTPAAILFTGLVLGLVNSLLAAGIILIYRTSRIINFAQSAIGVMGATLVFDVVQLTDVPFVLVLPLGVATGAAVGMLFELALVRRFFYASRLVLTVVTIAGATLIAAFGPGLIRSIPMIPYESRSLFDSVGAQPIRDLLPFRGFDFGVGDLAIRFGFPEVFAIEAVLISLLLVAAFFRFTRAGVAVRALAENSERASLLGINVGTISMTVWAIAGALGAVAAICIGAIQTPGQAQGFAPGLLIPALAAATLARFRSFPIAVFVSAVLGILTQAGLWSFPDDQSVVSLMLFLVIAVGLLAQRSRGRSEEAGGVSWQAVEETRPVPKELASIGTVRITKFVLIGLAVVAAIAYPFLVSTGPVVLGGLVALTSIIVLSLVVLTGWAGQLSLGQYAFAAVGGVLAGSLTSRVGIPFWFSVLIAPVITAGFAALVGLPALRIKGLFLAVTTFAFNIAIVGLLFSDRYFGWLRADDVDRPTLFFLDFTDERSMYFLCVGAFVLCALLVTNFRRSRFGRVLIALRENENNVQSFGVNVVRTKLTAFAVSEVWRASAAPCWPSNSRASTRSSSTPPTA
jgi:branched-chain amino acid transport system permease protein